MTGRWVGRRPPWRYWSEQIGATCESTRSPRRAERSGRRVCRRRGQTCGGGAEGARRAVAIGGSNRAQADTVARKQTRQAYVEGRHRCAGSERAGPRACRAASVQGRERAGLRWLSCGRLVLMAPSCHAHMPMRICPCACQGGEATHSTSAVSAERPASAERCALSHGVPTASVDGPRSRARSPSASAAASSARGRASHAPRPETTSE